MSTRNISTKLTRPSRIFWSSGAGIPGGQAPVAPVAEDRKLYSMESTLVVAGDL
jgi:hypothetical protein